MLKAAADGIRDLNTEYGSAQQDGEIFYLFHRDREWNPTQNRWMGHERKRGKLAALNALLLRGNSEAFSLIVGDPSRIGAVRYVITLDSDTQLPWDGARRMIETIDHPLNRPALNKEGTSVVAGYTIIQPRVGHLEAEGRGNALRPSVRRRNRSGSIYALVRRFVPRPVRRGLLYRQGHL